ncbi:MAG: hypothetical protein U0441_38915 [Polyangiaceae bacterium]
MISTQRRGFGPTVRLLGALASFALPLCVSASALANPRPLPFTYQWETLGKGEAELEQFVDIAPLYVWDADHHSVLEPAYQLTTEFEYGITDRLELGLYLAMKNEPDSAGAGAPLIFDGVKQRLRYRIGREGELPLEIALYFEVAELHDEIELEEKIILQKRFGPLKAIANLWVEQGFERGGEVAFTINPTAGLVYEVNQNITLGLEYWMHAEYTLVPPEGEEAEEEDWNHKPHHFVGPAVSFRWDRLWWTTGVYGRLDDFDRVIRPGDQFGRAWVRTAIGLGF